MVFPLQTSPIEIKVIHNILWIMLIKAQNIENMAMYLSEIDDYLTKKNGAIT